MCIVADVYVLMLFQVGCGGGGSNSAGGPPSQGGPRTNTRSVPLDQIISDISNMGFSRGQVMTVVNQLQSAGQNVDLNVILDRLTNGKY